MEGDGRKNQSYVDFLFSVENVHCSVVNYMLWRILFDSERAEWLWAGGSGRVDWSVAGSKLHGFFSV